MALGRRRLGSLKPAHVWLNLVGSVSLVIATTLLHFFPTVVGTRIVVHRSAQATVIGLAAGAPCVAAGSSLGLDILARIGALLVMSGALGLIDFVRRIWRTRARWTTDHGWHAFAIGGLMSAVVWFEVGGLTAAGRVVAYGADPAAWSLEAVLGPLVPGWTVLAIAASVTHLLPAVGPGDHTSHARQRALLGAVARTRLVGFNGGVAAVSIGVPSGLGGLTMAGLILIAASLGATALLVASAVTVGMRILDRGDDGPSLQGARPPKRSPTAEKGSSLVRTG